MSQQVPINNAWLIDIGNDARLEGFILSINSGAFISSVILEGDAIVITQVTEDKQFLIGFGRVFRMRYQLAATHYYFDGFIPVSSAVSLKEVGIPELQGTETVRRVVWSDFTNALKKACNLEWDSFPVMTGENVKEQAHIRELMQDAMIDDLLGPAEGPEEEIIGMSVRDRYLVGKLAPKNTIITEEDELPDGGGDDDMEGPRDVTASTNQSLVPSSFG